MHRREQRLREHRFDSPAGPWRLWTWAPSPDLQHAVLSLWATEAQTVGFRERVLPRETVELMVNFGGRQTLRRAGGCTQYFHRAWVSGLQTACLDIESPTAAQLIAASLRPAHAGPLLGLAGGEITERVTALDDILPHAAHHLAERLEECTSVTARFLLFEDFLRARLKATRLPSPLAARATRRIIESGGITTARALHQEFGCSARYLEKQMAEHLGLTPKQFSRLIRFTRAIDQLQGQHTVDWSRVAHACGFYDQSHFNNEFRTFTGVTPTAFLAARETSNQAMIVE